MNDLCIRELAEIIGGRLRLGAMPPLGGELEPIGRVVADSREVMHGDLFWGMAGSRHDGSRFAEEAYIRGAAGAVVSGRRIEPWGGKFAVEVEDSKWALWQLARWMRRRFTGQVVAVAGSTGKTTTRLMIDAVLRSRLRGSAGTDSGNDHIRLPLSMLDLQCGNDYGLVELNAAQRGDIDSLAHLCCPHIGVLTGVGNEPIKGFGSPQERAQLLAELFAAVPDDGWVVLNGDDRWMRRIAERASARVICVGRSSHCDVTASQVRSSDGKLSFVVDGQRISVPVWGRHHLTASLSAYAVGRILELSPRQIAAALAGFRALPASCQVSVTEHFTLIDDTSHCEPLSMYAALDLLRDFSGDGRRVVVCGDMAMGAEDAGRSHRQLGDAVVARCGADVLVACGEHAADVVAAARDAGMPASRAFACPNWEQATAALQAALVPGDVLLIKARCKLATQRVVEALHLENGAAEKVDRNQTSRAGRIACANLVEVPPFVPALRESGTTLPPG
jgi:UDP-N-acetylmuramoyl-tripeptide--D-alanyl-D-alanine ligase